LKPNSAPEAPDEQARSHVRRLESPAQKHAARLCHDKDRGHAAHNQNIAVHEKGDRRWAQLPAKPQLKDGRAVTDTSGKAQYVPIMSFDSRDVADAFSAAVVKAILEHEPRAFDADQGQKSAPCNDFHDDEVPF
jgi:hypothetical protein